MFTVYDTLLDQFFFLKSFLTNLKKKLLLVIENKIVIMIRYNFKPVFNIWTKLPK